LVTAKSIISNSDLGVDMIIASDGSGNYSTITAGFAAIPTTHTSSPYKVFIRSGKYYEQVILPSTVRDVQFIGEDRDSTILTYNQYAASGAYNASVTIKASNIRFKNLTFQNSAGDSCQALALLTQGDSLSFYDCKLLAKQDTYYGNPSTGRSYFKHCFIEGTVDFIYGATVMVFDSCTIHVIRDGGYVTAASTDTLSKFGINFFDCTIYTDSTDYRGSTYSTGFYLGRPWHYSPRVVYMRCYEPSTVAPAGWTSMGAVPALYGEYKCSGPGYQPSSRTTMWGTAVRTLSDTEATVYYISNIFSKSTYSGFTASWKPDSAYDVIYSIATGTTSSSDVPKVLTLSQNYPNPFNPSTKLSFTMHAKGRATLKIYNILGQELETLFDNQADPGKVYEVTFSGNRFSTGVYFACLTTKDAVKIQKMLLVK
jgi:pectinesterase